MTQPGPKVVHLSSVHPATDTRIFHKECRSLVEAGYDVALIARADGDHERDGVRIRAVRSGSGNRLTRMTKTAWQVYRMALKENGKIYHFHDPELIPVGLALKARGKRVIYDVHESVPKQILSKYWIPSPMRRSIAGMYRGLEWVSSHFIDAIIAATPAIADYFPDSKTVVVQNFVLTREFSTIDVGDYLKRDRQVTYVGGITSVRGAMQMIDAIGITAAGTRLSLGGVFQPAALEQALCAQPGFERVDYLGRLDRDGVRDAYANARIGLLLMQPVPNLLESFPVKLFEYMAAGIPVVASNFPFFEQFVKETGSGIMVDPEDPKEIAEAINWLLDHPENALSMGQRGREAASQQYNWESECAKLLEQYRLLAKDTQVK